MPDHLHFLVEGISADSDLKKFVSSYKQYTGYHYKKYVSQGFSLARTEKPVAQGFSPAKKEKLRLWQPSYYDHILRRDEDILDVTRYIFNNPVRKGLVDHYSEYSFIWSFELDASHVL